MTKVVALVVLTAATTVGLLSGGAAPSRAAGASGETDSASSALTLFNDDVETGDHSRWTSATGLGEDSGAVHTGSWATRATSTSGTIAHSGYRLAARRADCVVPKVRGKKLLSAKKSIRRHHCRVGVITYRFSSRVAKRRVLAQNPPAHSHRKRGAKVKLVVSKGPKTTAGPCGSKAGHASTISKVMWILMENKDYSSVYNDSAAPYETKIANKCGLASNYHAVSHPSLPNYVALTSGSTQGITDDDGPPSHPLDVKSIYGQAYPSAQGYAESMPSNCDLSGSGDYAVRHNPWTYYVDGAAGKQRAECRAKDVSYSSPTSGALYNDVRAGALPAFSFVTPNLCNDMHDCSVATGDAYLHKLVPMILAGPDYRRGKLAVVIVFDENDGGSGNQVYAAVISPFTAPGKKVGKRFTHYSLLRTTEEILRKPLLRNAATAASMRASFGL